MSVSADINLGPFAEDDTTGDLASFVDAIGFPVDRIYGIVGEDDAGNPGWSSPFDLTRAETAVLPWTAQFVGTTITPAMDDTAARNAISNPEGFSVGLVDAIKAAAQRTLTGTKRVVIRQRNPTATDLYIRTISSETPDAAVVLRDILTKKPWHLKLNYAAATGYTYIDVAADFATYTLLAASGKTYDQLAETLP